MRKFTGFVLAVYLVGAGFPVFAAESAPALSPDAEMAFQKGLAAAGQEEWDLACQYFDETLKAQPLYGPALFNLGLARARKGQELPAMAWLNAYLTIDPKSSNRKAIEKELINLEVAVEAKKKKAFDQAIELADQLPAQGNYEQVLAYESIFRNYTYAGDVKQAVSFAYAKKLTYKNPEVEAQKSYAYVLATSGHPDEALKIAESLPEDAKNFVLGGVAQNYQSAGKLEKAYDILKKTGGASSGAVSSVMEALAKEKRWQDAESLLPASGSDRVRALADLATYKARYGGDLAEARKNIEEAVTLNQSGLRLERPIAETYAEIGDPEKAERVIASMPPGDPMAWDYTKVAQAYAKKGDVANFEQTMVKVRSQAASDKVRWANSPFTSSSSEAPVDAGYAGMFAYYEEKKDWKNGEKYLPYIKDNSFNPYTIPDAYAWIVYGKMKDGIPDAEKLLDQMPPISFQNAKEYAYARLAELAAKDGDFDKAFSFFERINDKENRAIGLSGIARAAFEKGQIDFAREELLKREEYLEYPTAWGFRESWKDTANGLIKAGKKEEALEMLRKLEKYAAKNANKQLFEALLSSYTAARDSEGVRRVASLLGVLGWIELARGFESGQTASPKAYYDEALKSEARYIPEKIAQLGRQYADGLKEISELKKASK